MDAAAKGITGANDLRQVGRFKEPASKPIQIATKISDLPAMLNIFNVLEPSQYVNYNIFNLFIILSFSIDTTG
jgi:hypothetical protein